MRKREVYRRWEGDGEGGDGEGREGLLREGDEKKHKNKT